MKSVIALGFVGFVAVSLLVAHQYNEAHSPEALHAEWRRTAIEPVTLVRPARFEAMKWHPEDAQGVELRAPASAKKKSKKH